MTNKQRSVLITGACGGIGKETAKHFASKGWKVFGTDIQTRPDDFPETGIFYQVDISKYSEIESLMANIKENNQSLTAIINNAAIQIAKPFLETTEDDLNRTLDINLKSIFHLTQLAHPLLKIEEGAIVNISSVHAIITSKDIATYATTKGALLAMTRALAIEFADNNIRVNAVLPGAVDTPMLEDGLSRGQFKNISLDKIKQDLAKKTVIGRIGTPNEIAQVIYFLADDSQSSFITGQPIIVDGGATIKLSTE